MHFFLKDLVDLRTQKLLLGMERGYKISYHTHLFNENISLSLQKLRQYNKNLRKHQTKISTAINTNKLKL